MPHVHLRAHLCAWAINRPFPPSPSLINIWGFTEMVQVLRSEVRQARESVGGLARPWKRTGSVDVEQLLAWSYGAQQVERFERVGLHALEAQAAGYEVSRMSADGVGQLMQIEHMGCRIDRGSAFVADTVHPVALAVAAEVRLLDHGHLVRQHAIAGTRPSSWRKPSHIARPRVWAKEGEKAQVDYIGPGRSRPYCSVIIVWDAQREAWGRDLYRQWWEGLSELSWRLSMKALGFAVTGPDAAAEPWVGATRAETNSISIDNRSEATPRAGPPSEA